MQRQHVLRARARGGRGGGLGREHTETEGELKEKARILRGIAEIAQAAVQRRHEERAESTRWCAQLHGGTVGNMLRRGGGAACAPAVAAGRLSRVRLSSLRAPPPRCAAAFLTRPKTRPNYALFERLIPTPPPPFLLLLFLFLLPLLPPRVDDYHLHLFFLFCPLY